MKLLRNHFLTYLNDINIVIKILKRMGVHQVSFYHNFHDLKLPIQVKISANDAMIIRSIVICVYIVTNLYPIEKYKD